MTKAMLDAIKWLFERGEDGAFDVHGVALAMGDSAPITRSTWNKLRDAGAIEFYNPSGKGRGRLRLTDKGRRMLHGDEK